MNYSRQRAAILEELRSRRDHPSAEMIYEAVKIKYPKISLGTIYRNLSLLCDTGDIIKVCQASGGERYDGFTNLHNHFVCKKCGKVIDLASKVPIKEPKNKDIGEVDSQSIIFYGSCKDCM